MSHITYVPAGVLHCTAPWVSVNSLWVHVYSMLVCVYWLWVHVYLQSHTAACVYPIPAGYKIYIYYFITAHILTLQPLTLVLIHIAIYWDNYFPKNLENLRFPKIAKSHFKNIVYQL